MAEAKCVDADPASSAGGYSPMTDPLVADRFLEWKLAYEWLAHSM
jgi:hypothetical protein